MRKAIFLLLCLSFLVPGCATMSTKPVLDPGVKDKKTFGRLSDEEAVKMYVAIYNATPQTDQDLVAKNITLGEYRNELKKRGSKYLNDSGVFRFSYAGVDVTVWPKEEVTRIYGLLDASMALYKKIDLSKLDDDERALRVIRITGRDVCWRELQRRDILSTTWKTAWGVFFAIAKNIVPSS
jgi:hypothetical protein